MAKQSVTDAINTFKGGSFTPKAPTGYGPAPDPGSGHGYTDGTNSAFRNVGNAVKNTVNSVATKANAPSPYGSQSGPGILESWFNQRASGTDPAYEYAMNRGMQTLGNQSAAAGNFNSGAARQQESDFAANMAAQRMGQLDALAGGASGEHLGRLGMMFNQGLGVAGGQAGLASAYDLGAAGNMQAANQAQQQMALNKAGVDAKASQGLLTNGMNLAALYLAGNRGGGGGGGGYNPDALMAPSF